MSDLAGPFDAVDIEEALREGDKLITLQDDTTFKCSTVSAVDKIIPDSVQADQDQSLVWDLDALEFVVLTPSDVIAIDDA